VVEVSISVVSVSDSVVVSVRFSISVVASVSIVVFFELQPVKIAVAVIAINNDFIVLMFMPLNPFSD
jgi:hypothetical protein